MSTAAEILVIITSAVLIVFLILAIILVVQVLKVTAKIKRVAASGEVIAHNIERATKGMGKASTPLFFINLLRGIIKKDKDDTSKEGHK